MAGVTLQTAPAIEPVTPEEAKEWVRVDGAADDTTIANLIQSGREDVEGFTYRALIDQTWTLKVDGGFPLFFTLPRNPVDSITSITYLDSDGNSQTLASSQYTLDSDRCPARIYPAYNVTWPTTRTVPNAVTVTFVAGYGTAAADVPQQLKDAISLYVATMYENRELFVIGTIGTALPMPIKGMLDRYRVWGF